MKTNEVNGIQFDSEGFGEDEQFSTDDSLPLKDIYGGADHGHESHAGHSNDPVRYYFYPTWRFQLLNLMAFFALCGLTVALSKYVPALTVGGKLFSMGGKTVFLYLPVLSLLPAALLGKILINVYDAKFIIDEKGVEAQIGLMSMNLRQPRLRWDDIRGVEPNQTIWERILGIGTVLVGSAMTEGVEIVMKGVANPRAIQLLINAERERRMNELQHSEASPAIKHIVATHD